MTRVKIVICLIVTLMIFSVTVTDAQVRKRTDVSSRSKKEVKEAIDKKSPFEKINAEILLGNVGFFNGLSISSKLSAFYKLSDRFALGGGVKLFYDQYSVIGPDPSVFDYGGFFAGRAKITKDIYFKAEYAFMHYAKDPDNYQIRRLYENVSVDYPLFGLGYMSGTGNWRFGIELLYIANETARDIQSSVVEYWFGASYNF